MKRPEPTEARRARTGALTGERVEAPLAAWALVACLFSLSFSTVLFTLALFKLLSFFIMPSLFFDLLFIGFPMGAFIGARYFGRGRASFTRSLQLLVGIAVASTVATLVCKHFDYLRAHLFEVEIAKLLGQIGAFTGLFIPYFAAYGLSEYIGYQFGRERLQGRMGLVYALYLFGAAGAYLFVRWALAPLGVSGLLALALGGMALAAALLAEGRKRRLPAGLAIGLAAAGLIPGLAGGTKNPLERGFLYLYKGTSPESSRALAAEEGAESRFYRWGRYSFCEIMWSRKEKTFKGLYNDFFQWEYAPGSGFLGRSLGAVPLWFVPEGGSAAIIGAGGGRQVRYGSLLGLKRILALELEPGVIEAVRGPLADGFDRVYEAPGVEAVVTEARSYMERTAERFDLIYLPSVGGYPQMMLEPGNMIRTHEAYRTLRERLKPGGVLAIWYPSGLDEKRVLTDQYVRTLRSLDMETIAYETVYREGGNAHEFLILASPVPAGEEASPGPRALRKLPELQASSDTLADFQRILERFFVDPAGSDRRTLGTEALLGPPVAPRVLQVLEDPLFTPIPDEKPFLAGNVRHILTMEQVYSLFAAVGGILVLASAVLAVLIRRRGDPGIPHRSYLQVAALSVLIGANFLLAEHYLILALFKTVFVYYDALIWGAIGFLILSGLGSIIIVPKVRLVFQAAAALAALVLLAWHLGLPAYLGLPEQLPPVWHLLLFAPVAFTTGSLFPAVFDLCARNPLGVFAMDAVGAAFGSLAAFFLPIAFGFHALFVFAASMFLVTVAACALFQRGVPQSLSQ